MIPIRITKDIHNPHLAYINYLGNPTLTEPITILESAMRETLARLVNAGKQVIFITSIPMLDFDPATCVHYRPWQSNQAPLRKPCAIPQKEVDDLAREYRGMVSRVLHDIPQVEVWDSSRELCDGKYCWAMKDGVLLYRDAVHLSVAGSQFMATRLPLQYLHKEAQKQ